MTFPTLPIPPHSPRRPSAGPWRSHDTDEGEWVVDIPNDGEITVWRLFFGDMETNTGRDISNADLVAAAPDLLAVVRQVFDLTEAATYVGYLREGVPERADAEVRRDEILDQARAALAKATGGGS